MDVNLVRKDKSLCMERGMKATQLMMFAKMFRHLDGTMAKKWLTSSALNFNSYISRSAKILAFNTLCTPKYETVLMLTFCVMDLIQ
jgi:hypothetical protein